MTRWSRRLLGTGLVLAVSGIAVFVLAGCAEQEVVKLIPADYATWETTTEEPLTYPIPGHTSQYRVIHINERGTQVLVEDDASGGKRYEYPTGTIIVKANYPEPDGGGEPALTAMVKDPEHPDAQTGWVYVMMAPRSDRERVFTREFCVDCHVNANERHPYGDQNRRREFRDYVFVPYDKPAE